MCEILAIFHQYSCVVTYVFVILDYYGFLLSLLSFSITIVLKNYLRSLSFLLLAGGASGFFPDGKGDKPWSDTDHDAALKFWEAKDSWYPTWNGRDAALQVGDRQKYSTAHNI